MQNFIKGLLFALSVGAMFLIVGTPAAKAQTTKNTQSFKAIMSEIVRQKNNNQPLVIITPEDLAKLSAEELEIVAGGDPCETATPISINQSVNGQLTGGDCHLEDGSYADFYTFNGTSGQNITVSMNSAAFDTYLGLANSTGTFVLEDDNGGGGTNSRINTVLPQSGLYVILANSFLANQFGDYTLSLTAFAACTYSISPTSATIAPEGGTFSFTINTQFGCQWGASVSSGSQFLTLNTTNGTGTGTVTYTATPNGYNDTRTGQIIVGGQYFNITQPPLNCTYSINPTSVTVPAAGTTGTFTLTTQPGCVWIATYNGYFLWTNTDVHTGSAEIVYTVAPNNGADRTGSITVAGLTITISQPGLNCTYSVSPLNFSIDRFENYGSVNVTTQTGCTWSVFGASPWIIILSPLSGSGSGIVSFRTYVNPYELPRNGIIPIYGTSFIRVNITQSGTASNRARFDFDGDGKSDLAVYRPSNGTWYLNQSTNGFTGFAFGAANDKVVPADYDGDGKTDIAVFRDGNWYIQRSQLGFFALSFGQAGDIPMPSDFDLNSADDITVYRPSNGTWYVYNIFSNNLMLSVAFGATGDKPMMGDFDGDGRNDIAVYRPSTGNWYVLNLRDYTVTGISFGAAEDIPVPGDYDGDGRTDVAVFRPSTGTWYIQQSRDGFIGVFFGQMGDQPVPADYDGDRKTDVAVYRDGTWYLNRSTAGFTGAAFGANTDTAIANAYLR